MLFRLSRYLEDWETSDITLKIYLSSLLPSLVKDSKNVENTLQISI